jgi:hypothetical protein
MSGSPTAPSGTSWNTFSFSESLVKVVALSMVVRYTSMPSVSHVYQIEDRGKAEQLLLWQQRGKKESWRNYEAADTQQYRLGCKDAKSVRREILRLRKTMRGKEKWRRGSELSITICRLTFTAIVQIDRSTASAQQCRELGSRFQWFNQKPIADPFS